MSFGLGRGLEALIPNNKKPIKRAVPTIVTPLKESSTKVAIDKIVPNPMQPRKKFNLDQLQSLADSIKEHGLIEPLLVSPGRVPGTFTLVAGERRLRAAELAGLPKVQVTVRQTNDQEKLELALVENIQREDLNALEEARAIRKLMRRFNINQKQTAKKLGRSRSAVTNCLRLLELAPETARALLNEKISAGHARALLGITNKAKQVEVLRQVIDLKMSVRNVERLVRKISKPLGSKPYVQVKEIGLDQEASKVAKKLSSILGAKVDVVAAPKGGRIIIEYYSAEERRRIADLIIGKSDSLDESSVKSKPNQRFSV